MKLEGDILSGNLPELGERNEGVFYISLYTCMKFYKKMLFSKCRFTKIKSVFQSVYSHDNLYAILLISLNCL